jgi:bifunctional non-homologous end joining protein LigD
MFSTGTRAKRLRFVVHEHRSRRLHFDVRLEVNGVLASWAVPKGPSMNPVDKHLAVRVDDHPLEYRTFEEVIPEDHYGAGPVIVWDEGTYEAVDGDPAAELQHGKITFVLHGKKLRGRFTLVLMRGSRYGSDSWLLFKDRDEHADPHWKPEQHPAASRRGGPSSN